jgi:hypothetical protein
VKSKNLETPVRCGAWILVLERGTNLTVSASATGVLVSLPLEKELGARFSKRKI